MCIALSEGSIRKLNENDKSTEVSSISSVAPLSTSRVQMSLELLPFVRLFLVAQGVGLRLRCVKRHYFLLL